MLARNRRAHEWHRHPRSVREIPLGPGRRGQVPIDEADDAGSVEHEVRRPDVVVADDLAVSRRTRGGAPSRLGWDGEVAHCIVVATHTTSDSGQHLLIPHPRRPRWRSDGPALEPFQDLTAREVDAQESWRSGKAGDLEMPQQAVDGIAPRPGRPPHGVTHAADRCQISAVERHVVSPRTRAWPRIGPAASRHGTWPFVDREPLVPLTSPWVARRDPSSPGRRNGRSCSSGVLQQSLAWPP